jgi:YVTN family beta-propeller protein
VGQFEEATLFQTYNGPASFTLTEDALWFTIIDPLPVETLELANAERIDTPYTNEPHQGVNLKLSFVNANPHPLIEPFNRLNTRVSYFTGSDPSNWQTDVPVWGGVRYVDLYPGIDLEITSEKGQLVQRLVRRDRLGAKTNDAAQVETQDSVSLQDISLQVEGAEALTMDDTGRLRLTTAVGEFTLPLLQVVDQADAQIATTNLAPSIEGNIVIYPFSSGLSPLNTSARIAGASDLRYSTFLGGEGELDSAGDIAVDQAGNAYVTGQAYPGFPTTPGAFDTSIDGVHSDVFVVKLSPDGSELVYATFLGGSDFETGLGIVVDEAGNVYLSGYTTSTDFATTPNAFDSSLGGESDAFAAKFNPTGTELLYATLLGGNDNEFSWGIAVDEAGSAYVSGFTPSVDFPTTPGAFDTEIDNWYDVFVVKLNAEATDLVYGTYVGGNNADYAFGGVAIDGTGNAYVAGYTHSTDFPTTPGALDTTYDDQEIFVFKLNPMGSDLVYSTYLGGSETEYADAIFVDAAGHVYLTGNTRSIDFPVTAGAFDTNYNSEEEEFEGDSFIAKLTPDGAGVAYATFLGGSGEDVGNSLALDEAGNIYVTGYTTSADFPVTPNAFDTFFEGQEEMFPPPDVFVAKLNAEGTALTYATYLGAGDGYDQPYGLAVDQSSNVYVTGSTSSSDFPITEGAFDTTLEGFRDAFVTKLAMDSDEPVPEPTPTPTPVPLPPHNCGPTLLDTITVGNTPRGIALDVARQRVYVANFGSDSVSVIDSSNNTIIETLTGITSANGIAYDGLHNMLWVTNYNSNQVTPIEVNEDATSFTVLSSIDVDGGPWGVVYNPVHDYVYVVNSLGNTVSVINVSTRTVDMVFGGNFSQPFHLAVNPVTGKVYVANFGNNTVTMLEGISSSSVVPLWDSAQPYGIAVDETRDLVYVATVATNRIVAIGTLNGVSDQFLGWAAFYRGYNRQRPLPLRAIAVNPDIGPSYDGGHIWATTSTADGSELNQALFIPKGWPSRFHVPLPQNVADNPSDGLAVDRVNDRVYVSSGASPGTVTVIGDHDNQCSGVFPATVSNEFDIDFFSREALARGDATGDGLVDIFDLTFIASRYDSTDYTADVNADGVVDIFDLTMVASRYGQSVSKGD